jgi:hypothetical protein
MIPSRKVQSQRGARQRVSRLALLGGATTLAMIFGSLLAPRWFHLVVVLAVFGNMIGILLASPTVSDEPEPEPEPRPSSKPGL